jgi:hypothetical protein
MFRIRMNLSNPNASYSARSTVRTASMPIYTNTALNAAMIERIYKTKPGCSSCGKKVY